MGGGSLYACNGGLQVVERSSAARTRDILGLGCAQTRCLQNAKGGCCHVGESNVAIVHEPQTIGQPVDHERTHVGGSLKHEVALMTLRVSVHLGEDHGVEQRGVHHLVHQGALLAQAVLVVTHAHHHHLRMLLQASHILVGRCSEGQDEKFGRCLACSEERYGVVREHRIGAWCAVVDVEVDEVTLCALHLFGHVSATIDEVGLLVGTVSEGIGAYVTVMSCRRCNDHRHVGAADRQDVALGIGHLDGACGAARWTKPVKLRVLCSGYEHVARVLADILYEMFSHRNFCLRLLAQAHAYGVANAVGEQCSNAHGTLYASVLALTGFGHAEVEGIVHVGLVHLADEQTHGAHHDHGVAGLYAYDHVVKLLTLADAQKLHAALNNAFGRVAITRHYAVRERPVVHAYAHGRVVFAADVEEGHEALLQLFQLLGILGIGIFDMLERACRVHIVARVHAHLLCIESSDVSHARVEMDVGHERCHEAVGTQLRVDVLKVLSLAGALRGETHQFASSLYYALSL